MIEYKVNKSNFDDDDEYIYDDNLKCGVCKTM